MLSFKNAAALPGSNESHYISDLALFQANHAMTYWCLLKSKRDVRFMHTGDPRKLLNQCEKVATLKRKREGLSLPVKASLSTEPGV